MVDRLDNIRQFFPAEVTAAYLAIQGILTSQNVGSGERTYEMLFVALLLMITNIWIYVRFKKLTSIASHGVISFGFLIWVLNIDMNRFKDLPYIGEEIEISAPVLLVFYTLITGLNGFQKVTD